MDAIRSRIRVLPALRIPAELTTAPQPFLFRVCYVGNRVRRWMEYEHRLGFVLKLVRPGPGQRLLDVGCDWGFACMSMAASGADAHGVDIDQAAIEFGRRLAAANGYRVNLQYANARSLPFPDCCFDGVTAVETIEHVPVAERPRVLRELGRVLKPGGRLVLSTPNPYGVAELAKLLLGRFGFLRRRFYGSYHDEARVRTLPSGDIMVDVLVARRDIERCIASARLQLTAQHHTLFVTKFLPESLLGPARLVEVVLENSPLVHRLASTSVYVLKKT